jgi:hypothetical protein
VTIAPSRLGTRVAGAALLLALFACGEDTSPTTAPTPAAPTPAPPTPTPAALVIQGQESLLAPPNPRGGTTIAKWDFTTPATGTVGVTISYLYDTSKILVFVTDRKCNKYQFERDECFYLTKSGEGARPRVLSASDVKAGTYTLFVANDGPYDEVVGYKVTLLPSSNGDGRLSARPSSSSAASGAGPS